MKLEDQAAKCQGMVSTIPDHHGPPLLHVIVFFSTLIPSMSKYSKSQKRPNIDILFVTNDYNTTAIVDSNVRRTQRQLKVSGWSIDHLTSFHIVS